MNTVTKNRERYIGGSDIPTLFKLNKFISYDDLVKKYKYYYTKNIKFKNESTEYTLYGQYMENIIREYINTKYNYKFKSKYKLFEDLHIRVNTDGYYKKLNTILEIKTNNGNHKNTFDYELQAQLYMWAFNCDKTIIAMYTRPKDFYTGISVDFHKDKSYFNLEFNEKQLILKEINRNEFIIEEILKKIKKFWKEVKNGK
ncbi:YqaJ viral recombinase family protein [Streptobacillus moniliformis]|uniref:YqaJ viral recombinase family protein n=1 Tax=Streptobacillus moniliformis TaxID=34105 RepID=UPI0007E3E484|nr:YqaJ viral recombinase family protein [Streptobacillus moniliformis]